MAGLGERLGQLHPRRFFLETWREIDAERDAAVLARKKAGLGYDTGPLVAFVAGGVLLTLIETFGDRVSFHRLLEHLTSLGYGDGSPRLGIETHPWGLLFEYAYWAAWRVGGYFVLPALILKLRGERLRDFGLSTKGLFEHAWIYALCYLVVLGCVVVVCHDPSFNRYYPFYRLASRSYLDLLAWEGLYIAQFFALEFFFRGYWLEACRRTMGSQAIFAMIVPYVMIHFGKPVLETLVVPIAGVVLGTLAMRTRSIWSGFAIHVAVAVSMDVASLVQRDALPTQLFPPF